MQRNVEFKLRYPAKILSSVSYLQASPRTLPFILLLPAVSQRLLQNT